MSVNSNLPSVPYNSHIMALEEFIEVTGISAEHLQELMALDWLETEQQSDPAQVFHDDDILRVRRLERICGTFELPVIGGTIIVDLLDRIDRLERMVHELNNLEEPEE